MDELRKAADPCLVCTCNDLYVDDIKQSVDEGEVGYKDIFMVHDVAPRCCQCVDHVDALVKEFKGVP